MSKRKKTPSFIAEFPLRVSSKDVHVLSVRFDAARQIYNAVLGVSLGRLRCMRDSAEYKAVCALPKTSERMDAFKTISKRFGFTGASVQKYAERCRDACWIGDHLGSHDTQTTSLRAFRAVQQYAFGKRGKPRVKRYGTMESIEGKSNDAVIRLRDDCILYSGLKLPLLIDVDSKWQTEALSRRVKYVRIVKREIHATICWYAQIICEGAAPERDAVRLGKGVAGLDIGPSTIAVVSKTSASLERFCPTVVQPWKELRRKQRALDRSRRATNPENYNSNGTVKKGRKRWTRSKRYATLASKKRDQERKLKAERKRSHGQKANEILRSASVLKAEKLSYRAFQKMFGRSVGVRAPGSFVLRVRGKFVALGGRVVDIATWSTKLSQYDHTTDAYVKKPLSQRIHVFGDGITAPVQRDLYSAFLAKCCDTNFLDISQVLKTWPGAEPLLRQAMSSSSQPTSDSRTARSHAKRSRSATRRSGSPVKGNQNRDRGSRRSATKRQGEKETAQYDPGIPRL